MNKQFSGRGPGTRARENRGWEHWEGFGRWERKGRVKGVVKEWKVGEIGGNYPALLKICNRKMAK